MIKTDGKPTIAWAPPPVTEVEETDEDFVTFNGQVDHALAYGRRLAAILGAHEGIPAGIPAVSLWDRPCKGSLIVHTHDGVDYLIEYTRLDPLD